MRLPFSSEARASRQYARIASRPDPRRFERLQWRLQIDAALTALSEPICDCTEGETVDFGRGHSYATVDAIRLLNEITGWDDAR